MCIFHNKRFGINNLTSVHRSLASNIRNTKNVTEEYEEDETSKFSKMSLIFTTR